MDTVAAARTLRDATAALRPAPWTYHPLSYAWRVHEAYLERFGGRRRALLVGMNPGPWGMGQNGVPFGDPELVGDWLGLRGIPVDHPADAHPRRPVLGWASVRREVSGRRLWGHLRDRYGEPGRALRDLLVVNHCPLLLFDDEGRNVTPDKLPRPIREPCLRACDEGLAQMVDATGATLLIGVGRYAEQRAAAVGAARGAEVTSVPHPSPASPVANQDGGRRWREAVDAVLDTV